MTRLSWARPALVVAVGLALVVGAPAAFAQGPGETELRVTAQRLADGRTEFALQQRAADGGWGERLLPVRRFFPADASAGRWLVSSPLTIQSEPDSMATAEGADAGVRIAAQLDASGRIEFALQHRVTDGEWSERLLPDRRFFPADATVDRWLVSSPLTVSVPGSAPSASLPGSDRSCDMADSAERVRAATFQVQTPSGTGTAFYIGNGEWITSHHVVETVDRVSLVHEPTRLSASVAGSLPTYDLALLHSPAPPAVPPLAFAEARPRVATEVAVIGFPHPVADTPSTTGGVVSKHAPYSEFGGPADGVVVQVDAPMNPGNSGGPVADDCGAVLGVVSFRVEGTPSGRRVEGIGFGIAAETVVAQLASLRAASHSPLSPAESGAAGSVLEITAFCTHEASESLDEDECHSRSGSLQRTHERWAAWIRGVADRDDIVYRVDGGASFSGSGMWDAIAGLTSGCHDLQAHESGISTHWSLPYRFCLAGADAAQGAPASPTGPG